MKKPQKIDAPAPDGVDMERIKELMGPLPDDTKNQEVKGPEEQPEADVPSSAPLVDSKTSVAEAVEEVNESLKAMADNLDTAPVAEQADQLLIEPTSAESEAWLDSITKPEAGAATVEGEGVAEDDSKVVDAVADIVAHEGDTVLDAEDKKRSGAELPPKKKHSFKAFISAVWAKPAARWGIIIGTLLLLIALAVVPSSRYFILNTGGARSSVNIAIIDSSTLQPLKNVTVKVGNISTETDSKGLAKLEHLKLGNQTIQITKRAFTPISKHLVLGWGSNPQGIVGLIASGTQYTFVVTDFLSGKPIEKAEAVSGEGDAVSDKNGKIVLSLDTSGKADADELSIQITAANYRSETIKITASNKETNSVKMVTSKKDVFISRRSGTYDIYTIDVDGKNEKKLVSGTGIERPDQTLVVQQNGDLAAYVATRENARNGDGFLLSTLYLIDTKTGVLAKIDQSEQIQLVGWASDGHLVYVKIAAGASGGSPKRYRLITVNSKNASDTKEIASANAFNDVLMAGDKILYAPSGSSTPGLYIVGADGTGSVTVTSKETYNIFRNDYDTVTINASGEYYSYKIGAAPSTLALTGIPLSTNRLYIDGYNNGKSLWVDNRDGKESLTAYDKAAKKDTTLATQPGIKIPVFWLNDNYVIYRVNDGNQTADYVVNTQGGEAKKIQDINDTEGIGRWYYY
jgi:Tol biopolymer transport system component